MSLSTSSLLPARSTPIKRPRRLRNQAFKLSSPSSRSNMCSTRSSMRNTNRNSCRRRKSCKSHIPRRSQSCEAQSKTRLPSAAARRQLEDDESDLTKAFEGALLQVYGGDAIAVTAAEKLIDGTSDNVPSTEGIILNVTCMHWSICHG